MSVEIYEQGDFARIVLLLPSKEIFAEVMVSTPFEQNIEAALSSCALALAHGAFLGFATTGMPGFLALHGADHSRQSTSRFAHTSAGALRGSDPCRPIAGRSAVIQSEEYHPILDKSFLRTLWDTCSILVENT